MHSRDQGIFQPNNSKRLGSHTLGHLCLSHLLLCTDFDNPIKYEHQFLLNALVLSAHKKRGRVFAFNCL